MTRPVRTTAPLLRPSLPRLRRLVRRAWRSLGPGLAALGHTYCAAGGAEFWQQRTAGRPLRGPGPGHPERLVPGLAPSPVEAALWSRLTGATGAASHSR